MRAILMMHYADLHRPVIRQQLVKMGLCENQITQVQFDDPDNYAGEMGVTRRMDFMDEVVDRDGQPVEEDDGYYEVAVVYSQCKDTDLGDLKSLLRGMDISHDTETFDDRDMMVQQGFWRPNQGSWPLACEYEDQ